MMGELYGRDSNWVACILITLKKLKNESRPTTSRYTATWPLRQAALQITAYHKTKHFCW